MCMLSFFKRKPITVNNEQGPPDLEDIFKKLFSRKKNGNNNNDESIFSRNAKHNEPLKLPIGKFFIAFIVILAVLWAALGFYIVQPAEKAAVLHLGKFSNIQSSGLHWYPIGIDNIYKKNVEELKTISIKRDMLTAEENVVHVSFSVQYKISLLEDFLFATDAPLKILEQSLESAIRQVVGESKLEQILTTNRSVITQQVRKELEELLNKYKTGIYISEVIMQPAQAPDAVKDAFDDVIKAREDRERLQNEAQSYANKIIPVAEGKAQRIIDQANAYKSKVVFDAEGSIAKFKELLPIYTQNPDIITNQIYFDTMSNILKKNKVFIVDGDGAKNLFYGLDNSSQKAMQGGL